MIVLQQMIVLFIIMMIGFWLNKKDIINDEVSKKLSYIVVNIANPAMILSSVLGDNSGIEKSDLLVTLSVAVVMFAILIILSILIPKILRVDKKSFGAYQVMTVFSNIGFMGFPILSSLYGPNSLLYASLFLLIYNILMYTFGIQIFKQSNIKVNFGQQIKQILNIGVITCIIAIVVYLFNITFPIWITKSVNMLSNLTAPLSMMVIGASMVTIDFKIMFKDIRLILFSIIKLLVIPVLGTLLVKQFVSNQVICGVTMIMLSVPVGSMTSMLAQQYDGDYEITSKGVVFTTVLSVISVPIVAFLV